MNTRRRFLQTATAATGLGLSTALYTWRWEPHWLEVVERSLPVAHLPERLRGARLVQLSDIHIGPLVDDSYLIDTFQRVRELAPEFVVYTGDFISNGGDDYTHIGRMFRHLPLGTRATVGVLGNHDYGPAWDHPEVADVIVSMASSVGVNMLRNEVSDADGLQIVGLDDWWAGRFAPIQPLQAINPRQASIVLNHNPNTVDEPGWGDYQGWVLCGHTHGGQCKPPFLPPPLLPVRNRRYTSGEFALAGGRRMYISRGVGHAMRVRFNVRPEVTVFRLEHA